MTSTKRTIGYERVSTMGQGGQKRWDWVKYVLPQHTLPAVQLPTRG
jgi:hypothetical protein